ncbi:vitamin B6 photo-protection and homoeostasis-domain-containing protein [Tricharina praecox]|uniref:vitamin B6 photo-protection and homoeostasis-domain-containing protein n=1 Tax=Tricharina praecox TaxID=43433 RepID=UPI00221E6626|nr:vitamin B6 photo-protection and homoeostasis-domain-containing protein [Tricharina praecox]KAI5857218.1 vitamin B6 photo-protection and homoeostasis-domain-containing protein [Tricharina praecox]
MPNERDVVLIERDESGSIVARYGHSTAGAGTRAAATEKLAPQRRRPLLQQLITIFLPAGFPASVTEDYVGYQIFDSLQAFSSSIASLLTSRAVLQGAASFFRIQLRGYRYSAQGRGKIANPKTGFGVGCGPYLLYFHCPPVAQCRPFLTPRCLLRYRDANASATSALLLTIVQDSVGRVATILFAYKFGPALEAECKTYRFLADIFNDSAMVMDCLSPVLPRLARVGLLCVSGSLRALCGVAGGASKASLSVHFAKSGNVGELNAKDSSQETVISLMGMLVGSFVVSHITSPAATWIALISLLAVHLATNYKAVRCVAMRTLNRQRTCIVVSQFQQTGIVLTPKEVSRRERVLEHDGILRWGEHSVLGFGDVGVQFATVLASLTVEVASFDDNASRRWIQEVAAIFRMQKYMLWPATTMGRRRLLLAGSSLPTVYICLKVGATANDQVRAWSHALLVAKELVSRRQRRTRQSYDKKSDDDDGGMAVVSVVSERVAVLQVTMDEMDGKFAALASQLAEKGWDLDTACIETRSGFRITVIDADHDENPDHDHDPGEVPGTREARADGSSSSSSSDGGVVETKTESPPAYRESKKAV